MISESRAILYILRNNAIWEYYPYQFAEQCIPAKLVHKII